MGQPLSVIVGVGGAGGAVATAWADKRGHDGDQSSFSAPGVSILADGGSGGNGCNWQGNACSDGVDRNSGSPCPPDGP